jgi:hypothetical protein
MKVKVSLLAVVGAVTAALAVPVAASAHPMDAGASGSAFMPELPALDFELNAKAGRGWFSGSPPTEYDKTRNMHFLGFSSRPAPEFAQFNSDLAFQGTRAYQGSFQGFRILDVRNPFSPREIINYQDCQHPSGQGDVVIYRNVLTRSWDSAAPPPEGTNWTCGGEIVPTGTQGLHVFDVSNPQEPKVAKYIPLQCGSHTATGVPDPRNGRLIVYSTPSSGQCDGIDVISIPLDDPASAEYVGFEPAADLIACHDTGVILGDVLRAACAGGEGFAVWSLDPREGGSRIDPKLLYTKNVKQTEGININTGHSAAFSNDGETLIFGHEPNGGTSPRCQPTGTVLNNQTYPVQTDDMKSFFFFDTESGELQGKWTLPRDQTALENCTLHNYNVVPTKRRDILVHGSYQSGIGVLDFSDRQNPRELGYADPKPIDPAAFTIGGDWSTHFYNGLIYQSDITRGMLVWAFVDKSILGARFLDRLNPQTQEFTTEGGD